ncbi:MAG: ATP-binding protein [Gammaproteobacteria bacterium]|nr:ATP-binding protein [Gammaproteobacteria bacterium]
MTINSKFLELANMLAPPEREVGSSARRVLLRLIFLRSILAIGSILALLIFQNISGTLITPNLAAALIITIALSIGFGFWRLKSSRLISNIELFCHVLIDALVLVVFVLNAGGASNPLISYLLVLLAITATILPRRYVNSFALISIVTYSFFLYLDLQTESSLHEMGQAHDMQQHLVGMWATFLVSAILIALLITEMTNTIKVREINLAKARDTELRNEQLVAIGGLAAGTAHALGTPLSTMAILLTELDKLNAKELKTIEIKEDISLLKEQVLRCRKSLTQLTEHYNKDNPDTHESILIHGFAADIKDYILNVHPAALVNFRVLCSKNIQVTANLSFRHAVINIIENAIRAAKNETIVTFQLINKASTHLEISVIDDGPGIPTNVMENMGEPFKSTRKESMGLGIFLANAAVTRLGGEIEMFNLKVGGALTSISIPLEEMQQNVG